MTLIGVTPAGTNEIKLNPGIEHTMHEDDTCYYIGFTREEFSRVGGVQSIHHSLQQMCAHLAAYAMSSVGINPNELNEKNELETRGMSSNASSTPTHSSRKMSSQSMHHGNGQNMTDIGGDVFCDEGQVRFFIPNQDTPSMDSVSISMQPHVYVNSPSVTSGELLRRDHERTSANQLISEAKRGLQLFRFHSGLDVHANPVVKLRCHGLEVNQDTPPSAVSPTHGHAPEQPLPHQWGSHVLDSHQFLPRLSEASEERESSPLSEDTDNGLHDNLEGDAPPTYLQSQNDVFLNVDERTPKELEEGKVQKLAHLRVLNRPKAAFLPPLKLERETFSDLHPPLPQRKSSHQLHHFHHHHHHHHQPHLQVGSLKPHQPTYHRSLSEGVLTSGEQTANLTAVPSPHKKKGKDSPLYSSTLSLIVPEDEVKGRGGSHHTMSKSQSHEGLSPREIPDHHHHHSHHQHHQHGSAAHHFIEFLRHPSMWSAASSNHDLPVTHEVQPSVVAIDKFKAIN